MGSSRQDCNPHRVKVKVYSLCRRKGRYSLSLSPFPAMAAQVRTETRHGQLAWYWLAGLLACWLRTTF